MSCSEDLKKGLRLYIHLQKIRHRDYAGAELCPARSLHTLSHVIGHRGMI